MYNANPKLYILQKSLKNKGYLKILVFIDTFHELYPSCPGFFPCFNIIHIQNNDVELEFEHCRYLSLLLYFTLSDIIYKNTKNNVFKSTLMQKTNDGETKNKV